MNMKKLNAKKRINAINAHIGSNLRDVAERRIVTVSADSSNEDIREALAVAGIATNENWSRANLIHAAEEANIWVQVRKSVVPDSYKTRYGRDQNCGDEIAELMKEADIQAVANENGIDLSRWAGRNPGMIRMNLGNVLRGRVRRGEYVSVSGVEFNIEAKAEAAE